MATNDKLTVEQAAKELGYHPNHVRRMLRSGAIEGTKLAGVLWLIDKAEIERVRKERINGRLYTGLSRKPALDLAAQS